MKIETKTNPVLIRNIVDVKKLLINADRHRHWVVRMFCWLIGNIYNNKNWLRFLCWTVEWLSVWGRTTGDVTGLSPGLYCEGRLERRLPCVSLSVSSDLWPHLAQIPRQFHKQILITRSRTRTLSDRRRICRPVKNSVH